MIHLPCRGNIGFGMNVRTGSIGGSPQRCPGPRDSTITLKPWHIVAVMSSTDLYKNMMQRFRIKDIEFIFLDVVNLE